MNRRIRHVVFAVGAVVLMSGAGWLLVGETSPIHEYFLVYPELPNVWRRLNMPAYLLAGWIGGNAHQPSLPLFLIFSILQWGFVGALTSFGLAKLQRTNESQ